MKAKRDAEAKLGFPVKDAMITIPTYFNDTQHQATKDAGTIAGLNVLRIMSKPMAATLVYSMKLPPKKNGQFILVYNLDRGIFDSTLMWMCGDDHDMQGTGGHGHLGGHNFDHAIAKYIMAEFVQVNGLDIESVLENKPVLSKLHLHTKLVKCQLKQGTLACIVIHDLYQGKTWKGMLSRAKMKNLIDAYLTTSMSILEGIIIAAREAAKLPKKGDPDAVILSGGLTKLVKVQSLLNECFPG
ncbi:HSP70-domain-containing protein [Dacryopinax primogenitus]|uniref:HSP70-domain-containing protein n=1 Tax=Dacryopinax primogenitus (strain DJM 731) TaxID=1858805 RepID=M5GEC8_DACPD|nr:HSP70-domain-containing protein [Dacryopinax primogenitus]EJU03153.1 HSP70-domain-containing protein [Dacryopinax primogenitus]